MPANKLKVVKKIELYHGSILLGEAVAMEDGYYSFFANPEGQGGWPPYMMRWIADELDKLHRDDKQVQEYFGAETKIDLSSLRGDPV